MVRKGQVTTVNTTGESHEFVRVKTEFNHLNSKVGPSQSYITKMNKKEFITFFFFLNLAMENITILIHFVRLSTHFIFNKVFKI